MAITEFSSTPEGWQGQTDFVSATITQKGGMVAPVEFSLGAGRVARPYYISPWQTEGLNPQPPVLGPLRGDFFCLPFGADNKIDGEDHLPHGESSYSEWKVVDNPVADPKHHPELNLEMRYRACRGYIRKRLILGSDGPWFATEHRLSEFSGPYPLGHHATLHGGIEQNIWKIFVPPFDFGLVDPGLDRVGDQEYYSLLPGAEFKSLEKVPTLWKNDEFTDISRFPNRPGFIDLAGIYRNPSKVPVQHPIGWSAAFNTQEGYLWYSLKDSQVLPATLFWTENRGRHGSPWLGRNSCIGIEETCTFMADGRKVSVQPNRVNEQGIPTALVLSPDSPTSIRTIQGVLDLKGIDEPQGVRLQEDSAGNWSFVVEYSGSISKSIRIPAPIRWVLGKKIPG